MSTKLASMPTIKRLPSYLHIIENAHREGRSFISGTTIAEELELEPIQVRKDLAVTGIVGKPRVGFSVSELISSIHAFLNWHRTHRAIVVGAGHLGTALMGYGELRKRGLDIVAAFDSDRSKIGTEVGGTPVYALGQLDEHVERLQPCIAVLTVPSAHAQTVTELLVQSGIRAIWNFTSIKLKVSPGVIVQKEDLSSGYAVLSVKMRAAEQQSASATGV